MKIEVHIELLKNGKKIKSHDLAPFGAVAFSKGLPKAIRRALKAICWPFDSNIKVSITDNSN